MFICDSLYIMSQDKNKDTFDWGYGTGLTDSSSTGPQADHTFANVFGHYVYIEDSSKKSGDKARLNTPELSVSGKGLCLE